MPEIHVISYHAEHEYLEAADNIKKYYLQNTNNFSLNVSVIKRN